MTLPATRAQRRPGAVVAWTLAGVVLLLCAFAVAGSVVATPRFDPVDMSVPAAALALLAMTTLTFAAVGALVAARVHGNAIGWLLLAIGVCMAVTIAGMEVVALGLPGDQWGMWATEWVSLGSFFLMLYVLLLFPDGSLPSRRWRPALWFAHLAAAAILVQPVVPYSERGGAFTNPIGAHALAGTLLVGNKLGFALLPFATVVAGVSAVARYRHAGDVPRRQLRWFAFAGSIVAGGYLLQNATWFAEESVGRRVAGAGILVLVVSFAAVPSACGIAILRYRLYDVDRVVSRSVSYLLVTGIVVGVYVGVISAATAVSPASSQIGVAVATLTAAAVFNPVRRRLQTVVDRRFNRTHHDAVRLVEAFSAQLRAAVTVGAVRSQLAQAAHHALEPASVTVWTPATYGREPFHSGGVALDDSDSSVAFP